MRKIETAIFDMDGTLYQIDGKDTGYKGSSLEKRVNENALQLIQAREACDLETAQELLQLGLKDDIGLSNFLSQRYGISREEYFAVIWDISPEEIVQNYEIAVEVLQKLKESELILILLTAAPMVWQQNVINYLGLSGLFSEIHTGESFGNKGEIFDQLAQRFSPATTISIGDQLKSDIEPADALGFLTLLVKSPNDLLALLNLLER
jgi:FMN phosphatase YigB (HAD superfamily)